jgi:hypothetical protein
LIGFAVDLKEARPFGRVFLWGSTLRRRDRQFCSKMSRIDHSMLERSGDSRRGFEFLVIPNTRGARVVALEVADESRYIALYG